MTLYRPACGGYDDAMAAVVEVSSRVQLEAHVGLPIVDVRPYEPDPRNGWDTHLVIARWPDGTISPAGFTDGPL